MYICTYKLAITNSVSTCCKLQHLHDLDLEPWVIINLYLHLNSRILMDMKNFEKKLGKGGGGRSDKIGHN